MLNTIDLFVGCGGLSEGFEQSRKYKMIGAVEWEPSPVKELRNHLKNRWGIQDSEERVLQFDIQRTEELFNGWKDKKFGESNIIGHSECEAVINAECIYKLMKLAGTEESIGVETLDDYAVQKIIGWFQQQEDIDLELRSDIEFIYLPMLDEYSEVRPCALNTRLSLEPEYFCSLIELFYKERNGEKRKIELNKSLSDRLYEILFQFKVTPGIDWNGNFDAKRFDYWMKTVKTWSRDNDRYEVAMHTVGSGLSYAELDEDKLPQTAIIEELNRVENEELRRGYYLGIINQRGVHWIDPEGKPELELAEDYENRANIAESRGYSRYADILRVIADEFKREAKRNILEARNGDDE